MVKEGSPNKRNKRGHEKDKKPIGAFSLLLPPSGNAFLGKFGRGFWTDRIGQTRLRQGISAGSLSLSLPLTAVSWFLHRKPSRESDAKTNVRAR